MDFAVFTPREIPTRTCCHSLVLQILQYFLHFGSDLRRVLCKDIIRSRIVGWGVQLIVVVFLAATELRKGDM